MEILEKHKALHEELNELQTTRRELKKEISELRPDFKYTLRNLCVQLEQYRTAARSMKPVLSENAYPSEQKIHKTARGDVVRSKSEVIIATLLYETGLKYWYERNIAGLYPDFTVIHPLREEYIYIEHCGHIDAKEIESKIRDCFTLDKYMALL